MTYDELRDGIVTTLRHIADPKNPRGKHSAAVVQVLWPTLPALWHGHEDNEFTTREVFLIGGAYGGPAMVIEIDLSAFAVFSDNWYHSVPVMVATRPEYGPDNPATSQWDGETYLRLLQDVMQVTWAQIDARRTLGNLKERLLEFQGTVYAPKK